MAFAYFSFIVEIPYSSFFLATWCIFSNRSHAESTSSWGLLSLMDFLCEPQISKTPARLRYKKEPPRFEPHLCQQLCRLCVTWWELLHQQKRGRCQASDFWGWKLFFFGGFPLPSLWRYCTNNSSQPETGRLGQNWHLSGTNRRRVTIPSSRPMKISNSAGYIVWPVISLSS